MQMTSQIQINHSKLLAHFERKQTVLASLNNNALSPYCAMDDKCLRLPLVFNVLVETSS